MFPTCYLHRTFMNDSINSMLETLEWDNSELVGPEDIKSGDKLEIEIGRFVIVQRVRRHETPACIWHDIYIEEIIGGVKYDLRMSTVNEKPNIRYKRILSN